MIKSLTGYMHPLYADSLRAFGIPYMLSRSEGWILKRQIPGSSNWDAMGCYPLFICKNWSQLQYDLEELRCDLVCLSIVTDPFGEYSPEYLNRCFKDLVISYKEHFVVDLSRPVNTFISKHHKRNAKKAMEKLYVERCENPLLFLEDWVRLYSNLIRRHKINGIRKFSRSAFTNQLSVPDTVMYRASYDNSTVGIILFFIHDEVAYYHLGAYSDQGYSLGASFALFFFAIEHLRAIGLRWLNLGAGPGIKNSTSEGLSRFKRGWSTGVRPVYFCGRIYNKDIYAKLVKAKGLSMSDYFPSYLRGEIEDGNF